jgi:hypothetical protein
LIPIRRKGRAKPSPICSEEGRGTGSRQKDRDDAVEKRTHIPLSTGPLNGAVHYRRLEDVDIKEGQGKHEDHRDQKNGKEGILKLKAPAYQFS